MNNTELKPLIKKEKRKRFTRKNTLFDLLKKHYSHQTLIRCICAFLLSGTKLIGGATPLGFAFFASVYERNDAYLCALFSVLGLIMRRSSIQSIGKYIIAAVIYSLIYEKLIKNKPKMIDRRALLSMCSLFVSGIFLLFATMSVGGYPLIYDLVVLIVECATLWLAVRAFSIASSLIFSLNVRRTLTTEETVSLSFLMGGVICGFGEAGIAGVFSVTGTLCVLTVLAFATSFGSLHGCSAGIIMGIICCLSRGRIDACAASFAFSGLCAGYFSRHGKWASCISFIMANAVITILSNGSTEILINIFDTLLAAVILYCMPKRIYDAITNIGSLTHPNSGFTANKLAFASGTIAKCENDFKKISALHNNEETNKILLYRRTAHRVCSGCGLRKYCWGRDSLATREALDALTKKVENGEALHPDNAPAHCLRGEQFIKDFSLMFDVYKNDCVWTSRMEEYRKCVYNSFSGISQMLRSMSKQAIDTPDCDIVASDEIMYRLKKDGITASEVYVSGQEDEMQIRISLENCGGFGRCENAVCKVLENCIGKPFVRTGLRMCGECSHMYVVKPEFSITAAIASAIKANKKRSGDYAIYALLDRHTYAIILCDGMGSGDIAREESKACASLLMRLLETGLNPQTAINMINSMLVFSSTGTIAAIDLCIISLDDGSSKFYKCGGADTYAKCGDTVTRLDARTLPAGTASDDDTLFFSVPSSHGSMIVLVSDGVSAAENSGAYSIHKLIKEYDGTEPQELAQKILAEAKKASAEKISDDITVVAAYIE